MKVVVDTLAAIGDGVVFGSFIAVLVASALLPL